MINVFVKRPATTMMFILVFVLLGFVSYFNLKVEQSPRIEFPLVVVNLVYPGASPLEIETQVLKKVEDSVVEISEIKKIESRAFESFGFLLIEFLLSADVNIKSIEVKDKVDAILNELPDGIEKPIVQKVDPFAQSVVDLVLSSSKHSSRELFEYADKTLKNEFTRITGVGEVELFGGQERQIRVYLSPNLMRQKYISINQVVEQMQSANLNIPGGNIQNDRTSFTVRFEGEFKTLEQIRNFPLTTPDGNRFRLADIAQVEDGGNDIVNMARFNGENIVNLSVKKISDGNEVDVARGIQAMAARLAPNLPEGMKLQVGLDRSTVIVNETKGTFESIYLGILLTVAVLFFFTANWRITVIAAVVIPSSIISALFLMDNSNFTINFISLLAIATSLGTLIANAIVIIESVLVHLEKGKTPAQAAIDGTREVTGPVLAACGTNLVVFTPIAFMGGIIGQFMVQFGMTVVYATIFSLIASFSLTPMMCALLLRPPKPGPKGFILRTSDAFVGWILKEYKALFDLMFRIPKTFLAVSFGLFVSSFFVVPYIGSEFIPTSDEDRIEVRLTLPQGARVGKSMEFAEQVEVLLKDLPEVASVLTILGRDGEENASVIANLTPNATRERSDVDLINLITPELAKLPGVEIEIRRGGGGPGQEGDISIDIRGDDYDEMIRISTEFQRIMKESGNFRSVVSSYKIPKTELRFLPDPAKMDRFGVTNSQLGGVIRSSIYGDDTNLFRDSGEEYDIVVSLADPYKDSVSSLAGVSLVTQTGLIPISELGEMEMQKSIPTIRRRDRSRIIQVNGFISRSTAGVIQGELDQKFKEVELPPGLTYAFVGAAESQEESGREIGKAFGLAVILTYMLLAALQNSFIHPFTISSTIITSFAGVFFMLFFGSSSINIASMLGFVMLVGLAVNNAILILEQVDLEFASDPNLSIQEALWRAIQSKMRAVLMTSIAIIFGTLPQTWSADLAKASMGLVIVGGMLGSVVFTFLLIPLTYSYLERMRRWTKKMVSFDRASRGYESVKTGSST